MSWAVATVDWLRRLYSDWRGLRDDDTYDALAVLTEIEQDHERQERERARVLSAAAYTPSRWRQAIRRKTGGRR